jgi:hypothetical protein
VEKPNGSVIIVALAYESAAIRALSAMNGTDGEAQRAARLRLADTVAAIERLSTEDRALCRAYLTQRGRVPDRERQLPESAKEIFADGNDAPSPDVMSPLCREADDDRPQAS